MSTTSGTAGRLYISGEVFILADDVRFEIVTLPTEQIALLEKRWQDMIFRIEASRPMEFDIQFKQAKENPKANSYGPARKGRGGKVRRW